MPNKSIRVPWHYFDFWASIGAEFFDALRHFSETAHPLQKKEAAKPPPNGIHLTIYILFFQIQKLLLHI